MTAFDVQAPGYDAVAESPLGLAYRGRVRALLTRAVSETGQVTPRRALDLGCGTGLDARWLAGQGFDVQGFDASADMVDHARRRTADTDRPVTVDQLDLDEDRPLADPSSVDVALANFGVVNCIVDLNSFGSRLAAALRPGAAVLIVTMPRHCPTEWAQAIATATPSLARRRRDGFASGDYEGLALRYRSAADVGAALSEHFDVVACEALGSIAPTFEQRRLVDARPRLLSVLDRVDRLASPLACRLGVGDHHALLLERRKSS